MIVLFIFYFSLDNEWSSSILFTSTWEVDNITLLDYEYQFIEIIHAIDSKS